MRYDTFNARALRSCCWCLFVVLGLMSAGASAQSQTCYQWRQSASGAAYATTWRNSPQELAQAYCAGLGYPQSTDGMAPGDIRWQTCSANVTNFPAGNINRVGVRRDFDGVTMDFNYPGTFAAWITQINPVGCPSCPPAGQSTFLVPSENALIGAGSGARCVKECLYSYTPSSLRIGAGDSQLASITSQGRACAASAASPPPQSGDEDDDCMQVPGIGLVCAESDRCGSVNGDRVCPGQVPSGQCVGYASGGVACSSTAATPPAPDNGTPGTPAPPDVVISVNSSSTNYFNQTSVAGSQTPPSTSPPQGGGPQGGDGGTCSGEDCGGGEEGSVTGGEFCVAPPVCEGDAIQCAIVLQQWRNRCVEPLTTEELDGAYGLPGEVGDIDGDGAQEGRAEGLPGSADPAINILSDFDSSGWLSGRECPAEYSVALDSAFGGVISIPISDACFFFRIIGSIVLVVAWFEAAKIVVTGMF